MTTAELEGPPSPTDVVEAPERGGAAASSDTSWKQVLARYSRPSVAGSIWQIVNSILPYVALWGLMIWSLGVSYWLTLGLAVLAAGFLIRIFIIFHDCGHGSFFRSRRANRTFEFIGGVLTFTPYRQWRREHAMHHAASGDLDRRGGGDVWTLTIDEYYASPRWKRVLYRIFRHPVVLLAIAPVFLFMLWNRVPSSWTGKEEHRGAHMTNLALLAIVAVAWATIGIKAYLLIQVPIMVFAGAAGVWLFYMQHNFDGSYWRWSDEWDFVQASLQGSSFYKLPKVLQWFTGNIGFHHIHHLSPTIANYNLEKCFKEHPAFYEVEPVTLVRSLRALTCRVWDDQAKKFVGFRRAAEIAASRGIIGQF